MRDPYDVLKVRRGASFNEIKTAYRKACRTKHPDLGGSHDAFIELQAAYEKILEDLKRGYQQQRQEARGDEHTYRPDEWDDVKDQHRWEQTARDIDEELENLRRAAEDAVRAHDDALRSMRDRAWNAGEHGKWVKLMRKTWLGSSPGLPGVV